MRLLLDEWFKFDVGEGAFDAVFGLVFVILGITLLVLLFTALGAVMNKINAKKRAPKENTVPDHPLIVGEVKEKEDEGITPEVIAAISAAVAAYLEQENVKCDFVVRRIRKI